MKKKATKLTGVDDRLELLFRHAGLSEKQATLYRLLLIDGESRPSTLSKKSGIKRGNVYAILKELAFRGLVTEFEKERVTYIRPEPPEKIATLIHYQEKEAQVAKRLAGELIPGLTSQWKTSIGKPVIRHYEGEAGIHEVFKDIYAPKKDVVYGCVDLEIADAAFPQHVLKTLIPLRIRHKVVAYSLVSDSPGARAIAAQDTKQLRKTILVDKKDFPLPAEIDVYEDKVAMLSFEKGEFIGIVIQNEAFVRSLRSVFMIACQASQYPSTPAHLPEPQDRGSSVDPRPAQTQISPVPSPRRSDKTPGS
ncbi:hypothetical protein HY087_01400 [Candidatus Gottesmanbacteria bacterium]|nr:hypothetical protein [Candidatus Gottesmanbacteria bacterium]